MIENSRFQRKYIPSSAVIGRVIEDIDDGLKEMSRNVQVISARKDVLPREGMEVLFLVSSHLYDFYVLVEDCLLGIAKIIDKWVPSSLDWHQVLLWKMQEPLPEERPPVLSPYTASLLEDYLFFYLSFHRRCCSASFPKVEKLSGEVEELFRHLENELRTFRDFLKMMQRT